MNVHTVGRTGRASVHLVSCNRLQALAQLLRQRHCHCWRQQQVVLLAIAQAKAGQSETGFHGHACFYAGDDSGLGRVDGYKLAHVNIPQK